MESMYVTLNGVLPNTNEPSRVFPESIFSQGKVNRPRYRVHKPLH